MPSASVDVHGIVLEGYLPIIACGTISVFVSRETTCRTAYIINHWTDCTFGDTLGCLHFSCNTGTHTLKSVRSCGSLHPAVLATPASDQAFITSLRSRY